MDAVDFVSALFHVGEWMTAGDVLLKRRIAEHAFCIHAFGMIAEFYSFVS